MRRTLAAAVLAAGVLGGIGGPGAAAGAGWVAGPLFLIDDTRLPRVSVSWPTASGEVVTIQGERAYLAAKDRTPLGRNVSCYVAMGGTRLEVGASDPKGAIVRVGFYKVDGREWFFEDIADGGAVTIRMEGVKFQRPARARAESLVHHAKFEDPNSVLGCTASAAAAARDNMIDLYNTADPSDTLNGRVTARNGRPGVLDERAGAGASTKFTTEADGSISMEVVIPYALFKHPDDPWLRSGPGDFAEPFHFHVEFEVLPDDLPREEGR